MGTCTTKDIQTNLGIFMHILGYSHIFRNNQTYPGIIQAYPGTLKTLCNSGTFRTRGIFRTLSNIHDGVFFISKIVNSCNYFWEL